jgi:SAM-dependent methyltransferase
LTADLLRGRIPVGARRLLDDGMGHPEAIAAAKEENPALVAVGVRGGGLVTPKLAQASDGGYDRICPSLADLAGEEGSFDVAVALGSLPLCDDPWERAARLARLLAPGGRFLASAANVARASVVEGLLRGEFPAPSPRGPRRWLTRRSLRQVLEESGFAVESIEAVGTEDSGPLLSRLACLGVSASAQELSVKEWLATGRRL